MSGGTIHEVFRAQARRTPTGTALIDGSAKVGYAELDDWSDRLAAALAGAGVGVGDLVPVVLSRSPLLVAALLAVLKTGAAYAAFDPAWPQARMDQLVRRLDAPLVVSDRADLVVGVPVWSPRTGRPTPPSPVVGGTNPCCVFFTSGSTGEPKAVLVPHVATVGLFVDCAFARLGPGTVMPQAAPLPWDGFSLELWAPLLNGGTAVLVHEPYLSPPLLRKLIAESDVNTVWLTSTLFNMAVDEDLGCFAGLGHLLIGGERLSVPHVTRFLAEHPAIPLTNGYGPAECTVFVTTHRIRPADLADPLGLPVGVPVARTEIHVLDGDRVCAVDEPGEICVAGDRVGIEYVGDPVSTGEHFVTLPTPAGLRRLYRTGDRGRRDATSLVHIEGRIDRQVKIRGHRIEPGEVEHAIMRLPGVRAAVVEPVRDGAETTGLVGFYSATTPLSPRTVRAALAERLPSYLVPALLCPVDEFPRTANGKIDHSALAMMAERTERPRPRPDADRADDLLGALVTEVFADVLGLAEADVPVDASLYALGGTSLAAGRICVRLAARVGRPVALSALLADPTVRGVRGALAATPAAPAAAPAAEPAAEHDGVPLTPMQEAFWLVQRLRPDDVSGLCPMLWWLTGPVDPTALAAAVRDVHLRHDSLHTRYLLDSRPLGRPDRTVPPEWHEIPESADADEVERTMLALLDRPLLLAEGRVWRAVLGRCAADDRWLLGIVVHHIAFDGRSEALLSAELSTAYRARIAGRAPRYDTAAPDLAAIAAELRAATPVADLPRQDEFWRTALADVRPLELPVEPVALTGRDRMTVHAFGVPGADWAALANLARRTDGTVLAVALLCWATTLRQATGRTDFAIGVPVDKRVTPATARAVGCFVDMCCVPAAGLPDGDPRTAAASVRAALAAQDVPLVQIARRTGGQPYQTVLAVQEHDDAVLALPGCAAVHVRPTPPEPLCDLLVELWVPAGTDHTQPVRVLLTGDAARVPDWCTAMLAETLRTTLLELSTTDRLE